MSHIKKTKLYIPSDFDINNKKHDNKYFKSLSHHPINNSFDNIEFGNNIHGIHFATPGESLYMIQLGIEK